MKTWTIRDAWNDALVQPLKEYKPRQHLYASEIGQSHVDLVLKLRGVQPTNPPNERARRKFLIGELMEDIFQLVLLRCGLLIESQKRGEYQYDGLLSVHGRCDFIAGGKINYEENKKQIMNMRLSERMEGLSLGVLEAMYAASEGEELEPVVIEHKSVSHFMYERYAASEKANPHHIFQTFHYLKAFNMPKGIISYTSKDDGLLLEFPVYNPSSVEAAYKQEIGAITNWYQSGELPPLEKEIIFDELAAKFTSNWRIQYSNYLTKLYPKYERSDQYADAVKGRVSSWNRTIKRLQDIGAGKTTPTGKELKMTEGNRAAMDEMAEYGFNPLELAQKAVVEETEE